MQNEFHLKSSFTISFAFTYELYQLKSLTTKISLPKNKLFPYTVHKTIFVLAAPSVCNTHNEHQSGQACSSSTVTKLLNIVQIKR